MRGYETAILCEAMPGNNGLGGDIALALEEQDGGFVCLIDALGHGEAAWKAAEAARKCILEHRNGKLIDLVLQLHTDLAGSRGAAVACCRLSLSRNTLQYTGIGNISARIYGLKNRTLISRDGVVGYSIPKPVLLEEPFLPEDTLILSSDGLKEHFSLIDHGDFLKGSSHETAQYMFRHFRKEDDASCIVVRYRR